MRTKMSNDNTDENNYIESLLILSNEERIECLNDLSKKDGLQQEIESLADLSDYEKIQWLDLILEYTQKKDDMKTATKRLRDRGLIKDEE